MYKYRFLEIIRNYETLEIIKATLLYEEDGKKFDYETNNEKEVESFIYDFAKQRGIWYEDLVSRGLINETTDREIKSGEYKRLSVDGYIFPNIKFEEEEYEREKMQFPLSASGDYIIWVSNTKKIGLTPIGLFHIAKGGFGLVKKTKLRNKYNKLATYNYQGNRELERYYSKFDKILINLINGNYDELDVKKIDKFTKVLHGAYDDNFENWRVRNEENSDFYGACFKFSIYHNPNSIDYKVLKYFEGKYNNLVNVYLKIQKNFCPSNLNELFDSFYVELYKFIFESNEYNEDEVIFDDLNLTTQLILIEMLESLQSALKQTYIIPNSDKGKYDVVTSEKMKGDISLLKSQIYKDLKDNLVSYKNR